MKCLRIILNPIVWITAGFLGVYILGLVDRLNDPDKSGKANKKDIALMVVGGVTTLLGSLAYTLMGVVNVAILRTIKFRKNIIPKFETLAFKVYKLGQGKR